MNGFKDINNQNKKRSKRDQEKYNKKWRKSKAFLGFFFSKEKYLLKELIVNWVLFWLPIFIFLTVAIVPEKMGLDLVNKKFEGTAKNLSVVTGIGMVVVFGMIIFIVAAILKGLWIAKKKKGIYWPEDFHGERFSFRKKKDKKEENKENYKYR